MRLRSETTPSKRTSWRPTIRIDAGLEEALREKMELLDCTLSDAFELAIRHWLSVPIEMKIPNPKEITEWDKALIAMRRHNGETVPSIAKSYGVPNWKIEEILKK